MSSRSEILEKAFGENASSFETLLDDFAKVNYDAYAFKIKASKPIFERQAELAKKIPNFWSDSLSNCPQLEQFIDPADADAFKFLEDVRIDHKEDVRDFDLIFTFSSKNPFFKETTLTKSFTVTPPASASDESQPKPYDLEADVYQSATPITWTSEAHDLTKKAPKVESTELEEFDEFGGLGSFFNLFAEEGADFIQIGEMFLQWYSHALQYAAGLADLDLDSDEDGEGESDEEDEEDDDDDAKEIDLESEDERPSKKIKK